LFVYLLYLILYATTVVTIVDATVAVVVATNLGSYRPTCSHSYC